MADVLDFPVRDEAALRIARRHALVKQRREFIHGRVRVAHPADDETPRTAIREASCDRT